MFNAKERSDKQQLFETPHNVTNDLLKVVEHYGYLTEGAIFHEPPFEGNGLMTSVFEERARKPIYLGEFIYQASIRGCLFHTNSISNHCGSHEPAIQRDR